MELRRSSNITSSDDLKAEISGTVVDLSGIGKYKILHQEEGLAYRFRKEEKGKRSVCFFFISFF